MPEKPGNRTPADWVAAYAAGDDDVREWFATDCHDARAAAAQRAPGSVAPLGDAEIAEWRELLAPHAQDPAHLEEIEKLRDPQAVVSVTGQQAGAGLGPLFSVYKALGARHWAREIEREAGRPAVAVFWVASDDHDLAEIQSVRWLGNDGLVEASLAPADAPPGRSVWRTPIDRDGARSFLDAFAARTHETEFRPAIIAALEQALLAKDANFESQFLSLACRWLLPLGIVPMVPRLSFIRRRATAVIESEIANFEKSNSLLISEGERLRALGWQPPIHRSGDEINAFLDWEGVRGKLVVEEAKVKVLHPGQGYKLLAEMAIGQLLELLRSEPGRFSPNAPLRPLVQDSVLPTAVYTAGPTEHLYHGQIGALYELHGVVRPAVFPRPAGTLVEPRIGKAAEKLGLGLDVLGVGNPGALEEALRRVEEESGAGRESEAAIKSAEEALASLSEHLSGQYRDTGVLKAAEKLDAGARQGIEKLRERIAHHLQSSDAGKAAAREKVMEALFPGGTLQERSIGPLAPLLVNYGPEILEALADHLDAASTSVQPVALKTLR